MGLPGSAPAAVLSAGAVIALLLSACSTPAGGTGIVEGGPVAYVTPSNDGGDSALLEGTLRVSDSCVVIVDDLGQTRLPVFQRPRTTWDGTTLTYNGSPHTDGTSMSLGGGYNDEPLDADYAPEGCDIDGVFYVGPWAWPASLTTWNASRTGVASPSSSRSALA